MVEMVIASSSLDSQLSRALAELHRRIRSGETNIVETLRDSFPDLWNEKEAVLELIYAEYVDRFESGENPSREAYVARFPQWEDRLERLFSLNDLLSDPQQTHLRDQPNGYDIIKEIGRGGMAIVYEARQLALNRIVALKVLHGDWHRESDRTRIRREAEAAARLQHPHIVQIHEVGEWDGKPFLNLEFVAGGSLADRLIEMQRHGRVTIAPVQAATLIETLARAMQHAHDQGIIHRDLKPANILLTPDSDDPLANPKITDFGLAITCDLTATIHETATIAGTPCFMAPEQANAIRSAIGPPTDVYALGGILYELLTGRPPFQGSTVLETLDLVRNTDPVPPRRLRPQLPRDLETICLKCLSKSPGSRYSRAIDCAEDLRRFLDRRPILARPVGPWESAWKWCRRRPAVAALTGGLLATIAIGSAGIAREYRRAETERATAVANLDRTDRILTLSRKSLSEMAELGRVMICEKKSMELGRQILEVAHSYYSQLEAQQNDVENNQQMILISMRLSEVYTVEDPNFAIEQFIEMLEHADRLDAAGRIDPDLRWKIIHIGMHSYPIMMLYGGSIHKSEWCLDRIESHLRTYRDENPGHVKATAWHANLWTKRATLAANRHDSSAVISAYQKAIQIVRDSPIAPQETSTRVILAFSLAKLSSAQLAQGRHDDAELSARDALDLARTLPKNEIPATPGPLVLGEALSSVIRVEMERSNRPAFEGYVDQMRLVLKEAQPYTTKLQLPHIAPYLSFYHTAIATYVAALDSLDRSPEATTVLADAIACIPHGRWFNVPSRSVVENFAHLIERYRQDGRLDEARVIAKAAQPLLSDRSDLSPADCQSHKRLQKAIDSSEKVNFP